MPVYENINFLIAQRNFTKKEFCYRLLDLNPTLKRTGESPSIKTVYKYLNGSLTIPIELIPAIAEVLQVPEQVLFDTSKQSLYHCMKYFLDNASQKDVERLSRYMSSYTSLKSGYIQTENEYIKKLWDLIPYAPKIFIEEVVQKLEKIKNSLD